ncbi:hypothetical protein [Actinomyces dentalis]|uniref:hypothetical protein n=1 Tax=Actinomyces dentalis TaxID=272548 RepID=UPI0028E96B21|nr:hypothetical protein [Actinomyces dentalis]
MAVLPLRGSSDAVGVLGRWLGGADAGRAEDALLASYHLRDEGLLELAPAIARWVGVESAAPHVRRLLGMVPVKELRPVLVPALASRLREEPDPDGALRRACAGLLEHLGLDDEVRLLTDPDFHGSRTPPPEAPGEPGDDVPGPADEVPGGGEPADGKAGPADEGAIAQAVRRSAHFMRRAAVAAAPLAGNPDVVALIEGRLGTRSGKHNPGSLRAAYMLPDDDLLALVPAIVRWVDVERGALYAHRLLRMLPISRLRPVLVPAAFAWLHEGEMMDYVSWCTFTSLFDSLGLDEDLRRMADLALAHTDPDVRTAGKEIVEDFLQD